MSQPQDSLHALELQMTRIACNVEQLSECMKTHTAADTASFASLTTRIGGVEKRLAWYAGGLATIICVLNLVLLGLQVLNLK